MARKKCIIHYYAFGKTEDPYAKHIYYITRFLSKRGRRVRFVGKRVVRTYSAAEVEIVLDFVVSSAGP